MLPDVNKCPLHANATLSAEKLCGEIVVLKPVNVFYAIELTFYSCICVLNDKRERQMTEQFTSANDLAKLLLIK